MPNLDRGRTTVSNADASLASTNQIVQPTLTLTLLAPIKTPTFIPSILPSMTATSTLINLTSTPQEPCTDDAEFIGDVTIPDGTQMAPGQVFSKIWRFRNSGSCTWDEGYTIQFVSGDKMSGEPQPFPGVVASGEIVDISVQFTAPSSTGEYKSGWRLVNAKGQFFGIFFFIMITVK